MNKLNRILGEGFTTERMTKSTLLSLIGHYISKFTYDTVPYDYTLVTFFTEDEWLPSFKVGNTVTDYKVITLGGLCTDITITDEHAIDTSKKWHRIKIDFGVYGNVTTITVNIDDNGTIVCGTVTTNKGKKHVYASPATLRNRVKDVDTLLLGMVLAHDYYTTHDINEIIEKTINWDK